MLPEAGQLRIRLQTWQQVIANRGDGVVTAKTFIQCFLAHCFVSFRLDLSLTLMTFGYSLDASLRFPSRRDKREPRGGCLIRCSGPVRPVCAHISKRSLANLLVRRRVTSRL